MRDRRVARAVAVAVAIAVLGCGRRVPEPAHWPWVRSRTDYLRRAAVWIGGDLAGWIRHERRLDLAAGPGGPDAFPRDALVGCAYVPPADPRTWSGKTPKFLCRRDAHDDPFKVKWGAENGEIYAEVAGTRLLWALGFPTDRVYPVRVACDGCADDPWADPAPHPGHVPPIFDPAIAERAFAGATIEEFPHQGWTWRELATVDPALGGAPRRHLDALRLLGAFVQHRDSKADNQRLACPPSDVVHVAGGLDCRAPVLLIDDLGSAFGGPSLSATHKMRLADWADRPVWKDAAHCVANVWSERDATDGLDEPRIGEAGRQVLAQLLSALDRRQIADLFEAARTERRGGVAAWVAAFQKRRAEIVRPVSSDHRFRCPDPGD